MNEELILKMVDSYVQNNSITYNEFENLFCMLEIKEQYKVIEILYVNNIELRSDDDEENSNEIKKYKNEEVFIDTDVSDELQINKNIKQSNEVLCSLAQQGNKQAMQDLCIKNKRLVKQYAAKYAKLYGNKLDFEDLEQMGYIGLMRAAEKFEISKEYAFSTYAVWWIKQAIYREISNNGFLIRIPDYIFSNIIKIQRYENSLDLQQLEYEKKLKIIAKEMNTSVDFIKKCIEIRKKYLDCGSLNTFIGEEEETELQEMVVDNKNPMLEDIIIEKDLKNEINKTMLTLTPREKNVIELRFGLIDGKERTLGEIGEEFGVTRERIRQIEAKALRKMRHPSRKRNLMDFYDERKVV